MPMTNKEIGRLGLLLFGGAVIAAPLAVGGVHLVVVLALFALTLLYLTLVLDLAGDFCATKTLTLSLPLTFFALFAGVSLVQLVPLPAAVHRLLDPAGWEIYRRGAEALGASEPLPWHPLSLQPDATADHALRWLCLLTFGVAAAAFARRKSAWQTTLRIVVIAGIVQLVVGAVQAATGATEVLFLYEPARGTLNGFTTFINTNHAAVFYGLASLAAFGLCIHTYRRSPPETVGGALFGVVFLIAMAEHDSQGASIAYWLSAAIVGLALIIRTQSQRPLGRVVRRHFLALALVATVVLPLIAGLFFYLGPAAARQAFWDSGFGQWLSSTAVGRYSMVESAIAASLDHPMLGAGAGAADTVLPPYLDWSQLPAATIPTIENEPFEWLFTLGIPATVFGCLLLVSVFVIALTHYNTRARTRLLVVFAVMLHLLVNAQFHFPFFTMGLAIPYLALIVVGLHTGRSSRAEGRLERIAFFDVTHARLRYGLAAAAGLAVIVATAHYTVLDYEPPPTGASVEVAAFDEALWLRPADGEVYARAALVAQKQGDIEKALVLSEHAVEREPKENIRLLYAHLLALNGQLAEARDEYGNLFSANVGDRTHLLERARAFALADVTAQDDRAAMLAEAPGEWQRFFGLIRDREGLAAAILFAHALIDARPSAFSPYELVWRGYMHQENFLLAEIWARQVLDVPELAQEDAARGVALLVRALVRQGRRDEARQLIADRPDALRSDDELWRHAVGLLPTTKTTASEAFSTVMRSGYDAWCSSATSAKNRPYCWFAEARFAEQEANLKAAEWAYRRRFQEHDNPHELITFYERHYRCKQIAALMHDWFEDHPPDPDRRANFEKHIERCQRRLQK